MRFHLEMHSHYLGEHAREGAATLHGSHDSTNSAYWRRPLLPMDETDFEQSMHSAATRLAQIPEASSLIFCQACWV